MSKKIAVIGVGNMAKAIISGIKKAKLDVSKIYLFDINPLQVEGLTDDFIMSVDSVAEAVQKSDCILLSVKPQNFPELLTTIASVPSSSEKLYISIAAGISVDYISGYLRTDNVIRVLPNLPMIVSKGVSVVCYNENVANSDFDFVVDVFESSGSVLKINEADMNKTIGVTSSSPAYVFKFIQAICDGAKAQGLSEDGLVEAVCDMMIGAATLVKNGVGSAETLAKAVASKGGTTEKALEVLETNNFNDIIVKAMLACTKRADELGKIK